MRGVTQYQVLQEFIQDMQTDKNPYERLLAGDENDQDGQLEADSLLDPGAQEQESPEPESPERQNDNDDAWKTSKFRINKVISAQDLDEDEMSEEEELSDDDKEDETEGKLVHGKKEFEDLSRMRDTDYKLLDSDNYVDEKTPLNFIEQIKEKITVESLYTLKDVYITDLDHNFCPVLVQRGSDKENYFRKNQGVKNSGNFTDCILQVYNNLGDVVYERELKNYPLAVNMSRNAPQQGYNTLMYVPDQEDGVDGHPDIHIVTLPLLSNKDPEEIPEYRVRDWAGQFGKQSKENRAKDKSGKRERPATEVNASVVVLDSVLDAFGAENSFGQLKQSDEIFQDEKKAEKQVIQARKKCYFLGLTANCWLVIATPLEIHYACLSEAFVIYKYDEFKDAREWSEDSTLTAAAHKYKKLFDFDDDENKRMFEKPWDCCLKEIVGVKQASLKGIELRQALGYAGQEQLKNGDNLIGELAGIKIRYIYESHISAAEESLISRDPIFLDKIDQNSDNHRRYNLVIMFEQTINMQAIPGDVVVMPLVTSTMYESTNMKLKFTKSPVDEGHTVNLEEKFKRTRSKIGVFKKIENIAQVEQTMGDFVRLQVVQFKNLETKNSTFDFYMNNKLIKCFYNHYDQDKPTKKRFDQFSIGQNEIFFFGTSLNGNERYIYSIDIEMRSRVSQYYLKEIKTYIDKNGDTTGADKFRKKKKQILKQNQFSRVQLHYQPYQCFQQSEMNLFLAHGNVLSVYDNQRQKWGTIEMPQPEGAEDLNRFEKAKQKQVSRILQIFYTQQNNKKQVVVLRQDGRMLALKIPSNSQEVPRKFYKLEDDEKYSVSLKDTPIIWAEDEQRRRVNLIITKKPKKKLSKRTKEEKEASMEHFNILEKTAGQKLLNDVDNETDDKYKLFATKWVYKQKEQSKMVEQISDSDEWKKLGIKLRSTTVVKTFTQGENTFFTFIHQKDRSIQVYVVQFGDVRSFAKKDAKLSLKKVCYFQTGDLYKKGQKDVQIEIQKFHSSIVEFTDSSQKEVKCVSLIDKTNFWHFDLDKPRKYGKSDIKKSVLHSAMNIRNINRIGDFIYTVHDPVYGGRFNPSSIMKIQATCPSQTGGDLIKTSGIGVLHLRAFCKDCTNRPVIIPVSRALAGINEGFTFCSRNSSFLFMNSYKEFIFLPLPHLNILPLQRSKDRREYLITQRINNFYVAYSHTGEFTCWDITSGREVPCNQRDLDLLKLGSYKNWSPWTGSGPQKRYPGVQIDTQTRDQNKSKDKEFIGADINEDEDDDDTDHVGTNMPSFYSQNLFSHTLVYDKSPLNLENKNPNEMELVRKQFRIDSNFNTSNVASAIELSPENYENEKNWYMCRAIKIVKDTDIFKLDDEELTVEWESEKLQSNNPDLTRGEFIKSRPQIHLKNEVMFEFVWKRLGESSDLFFCLEPEQMDMTSHEQALEERAQVKILEVRRAILRIHRFTYVDDTTVNSTQDSDKSLRFNSNTKVKRLQYCIHKPVITIKTFPSELTHNAYHSFCLFSPDLKFYIDWNSGKNQFMVMNAETGTVELDSIFDTQQMEMYNLKNQLKFMTWHDNTHIAFVDFRSDDGVCKVLKVIGQVYRRGLDGIPVREPPVALNSMNVPFLKKIKGRDLNTEVFQFFENQVKLPIEAVQERYMQIHNRVSKYYRINRHTEKENLWKAVQGDLDAFKEDPIILNNMRIESRIEHEDNVDPDFIKIEKIRREVCTDVSNILYGIDSFSSNRFLIQIPFSAFDWVLMNKLSQYIDEREDAITGKADTKDTYMDYLLHDRAQELLLMILPECKTLLGMCYKNKKFIEYLVNANKEAQQITGYEFDIPFIKDFEGKSPLHKALDENNPDYVVASYFLKILSSTSFDLHSMAISDVLHKAVKQELETLPDYFDSRYLQTYNVEALQTEVYNNRNIKGGQKRVLKYSLRDACKRFICCKKNQGEYYQIVKKDNGIRTTTSLLWPSREDIQTDSNLIQYSKTKLDQAIKFFIIDIPNQNWFHQNTPGDNLCRQLSEIEDIDFQIELFMRPAIQGIVEYRWSIARQWIFFYDVVPMVTYWLAFLVMCLARKDQSLNISTCGDFIWYIQFYLVVVSLYFLVQEGRQIYNLRKHWSFTRNVPDIIPNLTAMAIVYINIFRSCDSRKSSRHVFAEAFTLILLTFRMIKLLPYSRSLGIFKKIIFDIIIQLKYFVVFFVLLGMLLMIPFMILALGQNADGDTLNYMTWQGTNQEGETPWHYAYLPFTHLFLAVLGENGLADNFTEDRAPLNGAAAFLLFIVMVFALNFVMLSLIVALISEIYGKVLATQEAALMIERNILIQNSIHLIPEGIKEKAKGRHHYILCGQTLSEYEAKRINREKYEAEQS